MSVAAMAAVAAVVPVVVAVVGSAINMATAMGTTTASLGGNHLGHNMAVLSGIPGP